MRRRDFTINAIARRLATGEQLDPLGGKRRPRAPRPAHDVARTSFRDDPLRIVRGLRFVSELGLEPDEETLAQMREWAPQVRLVSGERIGGGLAADGMGELSKLLLGARPGEGAAARPRHRRAHGDPAAGVRARDRLPTRRAPPAPAARRAPLRGRPGGRRRRRSRCAVRLAALFHDLGKPRGRTGPAAAHADARERAESRRRALRRLRYPTRLATASAASSPRTCSTSSTSTRCTRGASSPSGARARPRPRGAQAGRPARQEAARRERARAARPVPASWSSASARSPHRLSDLAVDGGDLIALGYRAGPGARPRAAARCSHDGRRATRPEHARGAARRAPASCSRRARVNIAHPLGRARARTRSPSRRASAA